MKYTFTTTLSIEDCKKKVTEQGSSDTPFSLFFSAIKDSKEGTVYYRIRKHKIRLQTHLDMNNAFRPYFYGTFHKVGDKTVLDGKFAMHPFTRFFIYFWLAIYVYTGGILFIRSLIELVNPGSIADYTDNPLLGITMPIIFLAMFYAIIKFGKKSGEKNRKHILDFVHTVLKIK